MADKAIKFKKNTLKSEEKETPAPIKKVAANKKEKVTKPSSKSSSKNEKKPVRLNIAFLKDERLHKVVGLFLLVFSVYLLAAFISYLLTWKHDDALISGSDFLLNKSLTVDNWMGKMGAYISGYFIKRWFGVISFLFVLLLLVTGLKLFLNIKLLPIGLTYKYTFFSLIWFSITFGYLFTNPDYRILGGIFGFEANAWLNGIFGSIGTGLLLLFTFMSFLIIAYNLSFKWYKKKIAEIREEKALEEEEEADDDNDIANDEDTLAFAKNTIIKKVSPDGKNTVKKNTIKEKETVNEKDNIIEFEITEKEPKQKEEIKTLVNEPVEVVNEKENVEITVEKPVPNKVKLSVSGADEEKLAERLIAEMGPFDPTLDLRDFKLPSLYLLDDYKPNSVGVQKEELEENKNRIVETLNNYAVQIEKIKATIGPTVTLYEIVPAAGVRISRIKNLEDDIALSLSALGIRIIAPIPGKGTIGIEVPNKRPEIVSMKSILSSDKFTNNSFELPIGLGKTIANESFVTDLTKMPHLLVAGATGQGKSVGLNAILTSLLYKKHPSQLKFVLIDPKRVELTLFSKIERHYLAKLPDLEQAIITDTKQVVRTLNSLCIEMDLRLDLMHDARVRNIKEYNEKFISRKLNPNEGHRFLPYIVLVVDEFADLIIMAGREIETPITRLAQLSRAIGIHLIIATQRPSVNIITGTIKANFPARMAFRVISKIDSRTILDTGGADQLIGRGDMLLSTGSDLIRLQCAFVDIHEVEKLTDFIGEQRGFPDAFHLPEYNEDNNEEVKAIEPGSRDELFEEAARIIVSSQQGSTSLLQRKLKLGYNRAGRIVDQLEAAGIIGAFEGSKAREVKIQNLENLEQFLKHI